MLETTLGELFDKAVSQYSDKIAIKDPNRSITYASLGEEVNQCSNALLHMGIEPGDRIALWTKNCIEYVVCEFAISKIGAVRVPLNTFLSEQEVQYRLEDSEVKAVICEYEYVNSVINIVEQISINPLVIHLGDSGDSSLRSLQNLSTVEKPAIEVKCDDLAAIMYTGGTTGRSKGVMHTHKSTISLMYSEIVEFELERGVTMLHVAPLPHAAGFLILPGLLRGGTHIIDYGFNAESFCKKVEQERVTFAFLVPTMIYNLLDFPDLHQYNLSSLKTLFYGAAPMAPARIEQALKTWGPILLQGYSQMEVANQTTILTKADHQIGPEEEPKRLASCGRPVIMSKVKIVDEKGNEVPQGEFGEIITRGPHLMQGYWRKEEETQKTIRNGWLYTGDMAYQDEEGYFYMVDRKKDMVISGGFNIYTTVVEKVLFEHPSVRQATVIGVPDENWGEAVKAVVVTDSLISEEELLSFCKSRLAKYEVPKSIDFIDSLPVTAYGKIDKKALRAPYWANQARQVN
ncbi:long-chain-fatty-acid--CoA ligase [Alkalihalobacterium alkalinitrilicum]|uniref:long-chain-fatty-acid--CoA ligase n=1 Tax=Alkalihalobacterium alkalinitrilicum TaxID=427920 RepID=UPI000995D6D9|nr:long-chain-fatty-acid--CoA ligase [Alkalihalobacterium alkalinitrilicum]